MAYPIAYTSSVAIPLPSEHYGIRTTPSGQAARVAVSANGSVRLSSCLDCD
jgi:hypothetical protein